MSYGSSGEAASEVEVRHNAPCSGKDTHFYYNGLVDGKLLVQKCDNCGTLRNPPSPGCGNCASLEWSPYEITGTGTIYSYTIHYYPPLPGFDSPHPIGLAEFDGLRVLGAMDGTDPAALEIGKPVTIDFVTRGDVAGFRFQLA